MRNIFLKSGAILLACMTASSAIFAANVNFSNATVYGVEVRASAMGSKVVISLKDSSGNPLTHLCDVASYVGAIAIPYTDATAPAVLSVALAAKAAGKTVTGWGLDNSGGEFCGIGNLAIFP